MTDGPIAPHAPSAPAPTPHAGSLVVTVPEGVRAILDPGLDEPDGSIVDDDTHEVVTAGTTLEAGEHRFSLYISVDSRATSV